MGRAEKTRKNEVTAHVCCMYCTRVEECIFKVRALPRC